MNKYYHELNNIQREYLDILQRFTPEVESNDFYYQAVSLIDKCELFWMSKRLEILTILDGLSINNKCFLLSGAIYLGVDKSDHYSFGSIGDLNIINDPVIKMKGFFIKDSEVVSNELKHYFIDAILDTIVVLREYFDYFFVVSLDSLMSSDFEENQKLAESIYWDIISGLLACDIRSIEALQTKYSTIQQLEKALGDFSKQFVFSDISDSELSLGKRVDKWLEYGKQMVGIEHQNEICRFFYASFSQIQQAVDILIKCLRFNIYPYIRSAITIQYFLLIGGAFSNDKALITCIEYAIICFLFDNYVVQEQIANIDFKKYIRICKEKQLVEKIQKYFSNKESSLFTIKFEEAIDIMRDIYNTEILTNL